MLPESAFYGVAPADLPARPVRAAAAGRRASLREPTASDGERKKRGGRGGAGGGGGFCPRRVLIIPLTLLPSLYLSLSLCVCVSR